MWGEWSPVITYRGTGPPKRFYSFFFFIKLFTFLLRKNEKYGDLAGILLNGGLEIASKPSVHAACLNDRARLLLVSPVVDCDLLFQCSPGLNCFLTVLITKAQSWDWQESWGPAGLDIRLFSDPSTGKSFLHLGCHPHQEPTLLLSNVF